MTQQLEYPDFWQENKSNITLKVCQISFESKVTFTLYEYEIACNTNTDDPDFPVLMVIYHEKTVRIP